MNREKDLVDRSALLLTEVQEVEKRRPEHGVSLFDVNNLASKGASLIQATLGAKSSYAELLRMALKQKSAAGQYFAVAGVLQAFHTDIAKGHLINIRHEVESIVVSEVVSQARNILGSKSVHPAVAVVVACAGIEEFLRNWCEEKGFVVPEKQRSISRFAKELRVGGCIDLPVERRIQSWADYRNQAAHGDGWEKLDAKIADRVVSEIESFLVEFRTVLG